MNRLVPHSVLLVLLAFAIASHAATQINVVYPKEGQTIGATDSTFIFGCVRNAPPDRTWYLDINGTRVEHHRDGGFIAFLPLQPGRFTFHLAVHEVTEDRPRGDLADASSLLLASDSVTVMVPEPLQSLPHDSLAIVGDYMPPTGDLALATGDMLCVWFRGTPGCRAWFSIPGVVDSVPMSETAPREQAYWGESVYGAGAIPESLEVRGVYAGFMKVPESSGVTDAFITYHLAPPDLNTLARAMQEYPLRYSFDRVFRWLEHADSAVVSALSGYRVSLNPSDYPFTVSFADSVQVIRHGPRKGYFAISQPRGVEALVVGREGDWYRAQLSATQYAWVDTGAVTRRAIGIVLPKSYARSVRAYARRDVLRIEIPLSGKHPFRVYEDDARTVRLQLFGVTSDTDRIRYDCADSLVGIVTWSQLEEDLYELRLTLDHDIWGYDVRYDGNTLVFDLVRPPKRVRSIHGKTIVIDPGHSPDPGAVGPTGYTEAEANLGIALEVEKELRCKGAHPVLTRRDNSPLPLNDRPVIAVTQDADLFVSIHNNALPDGVNPLTNHGTSTYYYHSHSMALAKAIHREMVSGTDQPDHGLYYGNLAVSRPTQYPAVLVECAFQILPDDEARLKTAEYRRTVARAIVRGIESFLEGYDDGRTR